VTLKQQITKRRGNHDALQREKQTAAITIKKASKKACPIRTEV
jgi:hypothetical protein